MWPEYAADDLRRTLNRILNDMAKLLRLPKPGIPVEADGKAAVALHASLSKDLDSVLVLLEQTMVENIMFRHPQSISPAVLQQFTAHIQALCLIATALLRRTKVEEWQRLEPAVQAAEAELRCVIAEYLQHIILFLQNGPRPMPCEMRLALAEWNRAAEGVTGNDRPRLVRRLVDQIQRLV